MLGDSANGYFSRLEKSTAEKNLGQRVFKDLTMDFHNAWHRVYFDNFFTCKNLLCDLDEVGVYGCGTSRKDRKG